MWQAKVYVTLKPGVLDPQGKAVEQALKSLGYEQTQSVRLGKYMELELAADSLDSAKTQLDEMCRKLLANTTIENYRFDLSEKKA
ncbi:MAG: phosphoribosylformylglycinamidine synthase subunit PurS [Candidatus Schekmanbacteria bacterium]|nr:phosphoribosylformylglycinamidine synthase subunit PurS [Candidatus Schekmanbacteria bacterium]